MELIFEVREAEEGGYVARALGQSIFTEAETWQELRENVLEATSLHLEDAAEKAVTAKGSRGFNFGAPLPSAQPTSQPSNPSTQLAPSASALRSQPMSIYHRLVIGLLIMLVAVPVLKTRAKRRLRKYVLQCPKYRPQLEKYLLRHPEDRRQFEGYWQQLDEENALRELSRQLFIGRRLQDMMIDVQDAAYRPFPKPEEVDRLAAEWRHTPAGQAALEDYLRLNAEAAREEQDRLDAGAELERAFVREQRP